MIVDAGPRAVVVVTAGLESGRLGGVVGTGVGVSDGVVGKAKRDGYSLRAERGVGGGWAGEDVAGREGGSSTSMSES